PFFSFLYCCVVVSLVTTELHAAIPGSLRPIVQENFQQLIKTNECPSCDLAGIVLIRVYLAGANLAGANLAGAKLYLADLSGANLRGANLQGAAFGGADLANADLRGANLTGAVLEGAYLTGAKMDGDIITRKPFTEDGLSGVEEKVYVDDEKRSKNMPYTQEVVIEDRRDFEEAPPVVFPDQEKKEQVVVAKSVEPEKKKPVPEQVVESTEIHSKKLALMADVIVPETLKTQAAESAEPGLAEIEKTLEQVDIDAAEPESVEEVEASVEKTGERQEPTAEERGKKIADVPESAESIEVKKNVKIEEEHQEVVAEVEQTPQPTEEAKDEQQSPVEIDAADEAVDETAYTVEAQEKESEQEVREPAGQAGDTVDTGDVQTEPEVAADSSVSDMIATIEGAGEKASAASEGVVYTVQTPEEAAIKQLAIIEQLLDDNRCVECNLAGVDLSDRNLDEVDLERANLQGANLQGVDFSEANLKGANLRGANLKDADLREADLYRADFSGADMTGARLEKALIDSTDFTGAIGVNLAGALPAQ
ncbi:MAG: hypothetical protein GQ559_07510, partial [Desulfobulbaceae bacterium]|nr:hypothetical protein [Desulfobulbaceae bacterium]